MFMPHQCTKCGKIFPDAAEELLKGCACGSKFFYYIKQEKFELLQGEARKVMTELDKADKEQIEKDIRELTGLDKRPDEPVILDLESVRVLKPGKFEIDIVNLFSKNRPLIYKLGEGKYIIDLASSLKTEKTNRVKEYSNTIDFDKEYEKEDSEEDEADEADEGDEGDEGDNDFDELE